ncbi:hypothetical protein BMS3Abin13_00983 [bacterium BMS3Abin13]|nr:hypothetical protein BMS3Abin13_00983 [bacterium BMS3Abin13]
MKQNLKTLVIIFSVVLNIVFIGSYVYHRSDLTFITDHNTHHNRPLYEDLNLNRKQLDRFESIRDGFHNFVNKQGRKIKADRLELIDLLAKKNPNRRAIDAKQKEIQVLQQQMQAKVINHLLEESKIFTPEQRVKFFGLIRDRIEKSENPRPRWMQRTRPTPAEGGRS